MAEILNWDIDPSKPFACPHCGEEGYLALLYLCCEAYEAEFEAFQASYDHSDEMPLVVSYRTAKLLKELFNKGDVK